MNRNAQYFLSDHAHDDIENLRRFLFLQGEQESFQLVYLRIEKAIHLICQFPKIGVYNLNIDAREFFVQKTSYKIIFEEQDGVIHILRFFHTSQKCN